MTIRSRRLCAAVVAAATLATLTAVTARADPPSVQVVLPVVDGGVAVTVAPGTLSGPAPAPVVPATTPPTPAAPAPTPPATPPSMAQTSPPSLPPSVSAPVTAAPPSAPTETTPTPLPGPATADPTPGVSPAAPPLPTWAPLPSARPTYVTPTPAASPATLPPATPGTTTAATAAGGGFLLGVFAHSTDRVDRFEEKVGRDVQVLGVFPARGSWESIMDTWWLDRAPAGFTGILDVGVPLWQEDGDLATAAQGGYDAQWEELGRVIHERYPGSVVRIGWEFNLGGWNHHASDENVEEWKQAFRHASVALKKGGPSLLVDWNPNKGKGDSLSDATRAWPGDDVVDIVGLDAYDWWPAYSESTWPEHRDGDQGWQFWVDFARAHGKKFAVPEWGVAPGNDHGGGDNPYYIDVVMDFLAAEHAKDGIVHSAVYFDEPDSYIANSIGDGQVPMAGQALAERLASLGTAAPAPRPARSPAETGSRETAGTTPAEPPTPSPAEDDSPPSTAVASPETTPATAPDDESGSSTEQSASWGASDGHGPVPR